MASSALKELEVILTKNKQYFDNRAPDNFKREKEIFDEKIRKGRFAYLTKNREFYRQLFNSIDDSCDKMKETIDQSSARVEKILKLNSDT